VSARTTKGDGTMSAEIRDPISRVRQTFSIEGESLVVDNWLDPGRKLPPHYHPQQEERWSVVDGRVLGRVPRLPW